VYIRPARVFAVSVLVAAVLGTAALAFAKPASAAPACWRQILNEWTDTGRVSTDYSLHCYRDAIAHVPEDLLVYTDIEQDILAARQQAARGNRTLQIHDGTSTDRTASNDPDSGLYNNAIGKLGPTNADSLPLPLLILAGMSMILIAAGGAGLVSKRVKARKVPG
jgi:hypothetical protein